MKHRRRNHRAEIKPPPVPGPSRYSQTEIKELMRRFIESNGKYRLNDGEQQEQFVFTD